MVCLDFQGAYPDPPVVGGNQGPSLGVVAWVLGSPWAGSYKGQVGVLVARILLQQVDLQGCCNLWGPSAASVLASGVADGMTSPCLAGSQ